MTKLYNNDCFEQLKEIEENSVDTIITDPPYGLSFMGKKWDYDVPKIEIWKECLRVLKPGGTALIFAGSRTQHRMACNVEDAGFILKDCIMWLYGSGFPKATDISKQLDKGHERKVVGKKNHNPVWHKKHTQNDDNWTGAEDGGTNITKPSTPEAKLWNGWKSHGLKPAYEPILVAQKANDGTYANNALVWGVSGLNIDGGRITYQSEDDKKKGTPASLSKNRFTGNSYNNGNKGHLEVMHNQSPQGRFPANIILDEEAGEMLDEQSGVSKSSKSYKGKRPKSPAEVGDREYVEDNKEPRGHSDKGGASRFFYCAKASKKERGDGNVHPTVKPLKLMEYLCTLTKTPTGGIVLDPFMGSGTTGVASVNTGRDFIGIERKVEFFKIAEARIRFASSQTKLSI
tara:strand:+ start:204 stop:1406 length:1203 start_codon:yes stop_codon:yes gene_type:complete